MQLNLKPMNQKPILLSGAQPSGDLHLGNLFGAIENWVKLQKTHQSLFGIMDLHAITTKQEPSKLKQNVIDLAIIYLACDIEPSNIFVQSHVKEHLELAWILSCHTPMGWLNRMTQFKDKSQKLSNQEQIKHGLYSYPVLMAADILLYKTNFVPTGNDQKQHIELTKEICQSFNNCYKTDFLVAPEYIYSNSQRVMSLADAKNKMSKSDPSNLSRINLTDNAATILKKIKKCKTDSIAEITYDENRPEIKNLLHIFSSCIDKKPAIISEEYHNKGFAIFKKDLTEALILKLEPIQAKIKNLQNNLPYIQKVLKNGAEKASKIASENMAKIKNIVGL